jgi:hypothetical protein
MRSNGRRSSETIAGQRSESETIIGEIGNEDRAAESFARGESGLAEKITILMNELSDAKHERTQSQESMVELKARIQTLQYLFHLLKQ